MIRNFKYPVYKDILFAAMFRMTTCSCRTRVSDKFTLTRRLKRYKEDGQ